MKILKNYRHLLFPTNESIDKSITFIDNVKKIDTKVLQGLVDSFGKVIENLNQLLSNTALLDSDRQHIETTLDMIKLMNEKYVEKLDKCKREK